MKIDVAHVAKLANLPLTDEEKMKFEQQLEETLEYIKHLEEVDTENVQITPQVTRLQNVVDEDVVRPSLSQDEALANASSKHKGFFKVKAILESV